MERFFNSLSLKSKIFLSFFILILLSGVFTFYYYKTSTKIESLRIDRRKLFELTILSKNYKILYQQLLNSESKKDDFYISGAKNHQVPFIKYYANYVQLIQSLKLNTYKELNTNENILVVENSKMLQEKLKIQNNQIVALLLKIGFKDYGIEGQLRKSAHTLEKMNTTMDKADLLMLRRHEKDFIIRKDLKYISQLNSLVNSLLLSKKLNMQEQQLLEDYQSKFNQYADLEKKLSIGDNSESKKINTIIESIEFNTNHLSSIYANFISIKIQQYQQFLNTLIIVQILLGLFLAIVFSTVFTNKINAITQTLLTLNNGNFPQPLKINNADELGIAALSVNNLIERIRAAVNFTNSIKAKNFEEIYNQEFKKDILAINLIDLQSKLREFEIEKENKFWINEQIKNLNSLLMSQPTIESVLKMLINNTNAIGGVYYGKQVESDEKLHLQATFGIDKNSIPQEITKNESLIGQVYTDKKVCIVTPNEYKFEIITGLGKEYAIQLYIAPILYSDTTYGILELAFIKEIELYKIEYLNEAISIYSSELYKQEQQFIVKKLLEESEEKNQMLLAQEEELRQNTEELIATQDEIQRQKEILEEKIKSLNAMEFQNLV